MEKFTTLEAIAAPMPNDNIDTDIICPARFLTTTKKTGLEKCAFHDLMFNDKGEENPDFIYFQISKTKMRGISFFSLFLMIAGQVEINLGIPEGSQ